MNRILIIQTGKLGDMVCTTPVFRAIKNHYKESYLIVSGDKVNREALAGNPNVDEYMELSEISVRSLRSKRLDTAVLLNPNPGVLFKLLASGIKKIVVPKIVGGFSPFSTKSYRILSLFATRVLHRFGHYAPQEYLNALEPLGIKSTDTRKDLYFDSDAEQKVKESIDSYRGSIKIAISPSAGNKIKNWGGKNFAKLADEIYKRWKPHIFIVGGSRDKDEVRELLDNLSSETPVIDLSMKLSVEELKVFISMMDMFISVDTGPIYMAEASGVRTVDIIGPMDENEQPPHDDKHRLVYLKERKAPAIHIMNARIYDSKEARRQIEEITPEMVLKEVERLLI